MTGTAGGLQLQHGGLCPFNWSVPMWYQSLHFMNATAVYICAKILEEVPSGYAYQTLRTFSIEGFHQGSLCPLSCCRHSQWAESKSTSITLYVDVTKHLPPVLAGVPGGLVLPGKQGLGPDTKTPSMLLSFVFFFLFFLSSLPCLNSQKSLREFRKSQGRILWGKEAVSGRQMAFHIPWGTVSKQPTQMYNLGTNMNHQPDTSSSHSKISGQTSQYVPQIQGGKRGVGKGKMEDRLNKQNDMPHKLKYNQGKNRI